MPKPQITKSEATRRFWAALNRRYQERIYRTEAYVTAVTRDEAGRAVSATATIDGTSSQKVQIGYGSIIAPGDTFLVANAGASTSPFWVAERRLQAAVTLPPLDPSVVLPAPGALNLISWLTPPEPGGGQKAFIFAYWFTIGDQYGPIFYDIQGKLNDPDPDNPFVFEVTALDNQQHHVATAAAITAAQTFIPREAAQTAEVDPRQGRVQLEAEKIDYTAITWDGGDSGTGGVGGKDTFTVAGAGWTEDEWIGYALQDGGGNWYLITANTSEVLTISGTTTSGIWAITPALSGCTRGVGGTSAATHVIETGIFFLTFGATIPNLAPNTDYNVRVRARSAAGAISEWTAWASVQTEIDTTPPPAPSGLTVTPAVGRVALSWTGPVPADCPDLTGFEIYRSAKSDGSDPVLVRTVGAALSVGVDAEPGATLYYNLKAFDASGNKSAFGASWVLGAAMAGPGVQLLTNADWERDLNGDGVADEWYEVGVCDLGSYGRQGGKGYRLTPPSPTIIPTYAYVAWDPYTTGYRYPAVPGQYYVASIYIKPDSSAPPGDLWYGHYEGPRGSAIFCLFPTIFFTDGLAPVSGYESLGATSGDDFLQIEDAGDGWVRIWIRHLVTEEDVEDGAYIGMAVVAFKTQACTYYADYDRPQLEQGYWPSAWGAGLVHPLGTSNQGLHIDTRGIVSAGAILGPAGTWYSGLKPNADNTYDLGAVGGVSEKGGVYADQRWRNGYFGTDLRAGGDVRAAGGLYVGADSDPPADAVIVDGYVSIGSPTKSSKLTRGLSIQQDSYDDEALALKSSDVAHGMTDYTDTDAFVVMGKESGPSGGLLLRGLTEDGIGIHLVSHPTSDYTTKGASAYGSFTLSSFKKSGTGGGAHGANANLLVVRNYSGVVLIVDAEGDLTYMGDLKPYRNSQEYTGCVFVPLTTPLASTSWDGDSFSTTAKTKIDLSAVFSAPAGIKAVLVGGSIRDSGAATTASFFYLSPSDTAEYGPMICRALPHNDEWTPFSGVVPCDSGGDVYYRVIASGAGTMDVNLIIWGYWI